MTQNRNFAAALWAAKASMWLGDLTRNGLRTDNLGERIDNVRRRDHHEPHDVSARGVEGARLQRAD
jgi:hypothetical protein